MAYKFDRDPSGFPERSNLIRDIRIMLSFAVEMILLKEALRWMRRERGVVACNTTGVKKLPPVG